MRISRVLLAVGLSATSVGVWASAAGANCIGPSITFTPHDVGRGETVAVSATGWGDNCYDTGPPPVGEGVLGRPIADITVVLVQGDREWELWTGAANADYEFSADVTVPPDVAPGVAILAARRGDSPTGWNVMAYNPEPDLRISAAPPVSTTSTSAAPTSTVHTPSSSRASSDSDGGISTVATLGVIAVGVAMLVAAALVVRRRHA